jgi:outer membrane usher protein
MRSLNHAIDARILFFWTLALLFGTLLDTQGLRASEGRQDLQLEVTINNVPTNIISAFVLLSDNRMGTTRSDLHELGIRINAPGQPADVIMLDEIPTLKYDYNEKTQTIRITIDDTYREPNAFDVAKIANRRPKRSPTDFGAVLNYDLFATTGLGDPRWSSFSGSSLTLDGRVFSPYGTLSQSGIFSTPTGQDSNVIRLDTRFRTSDEERLISYTAGDTINGGLAWTRPIRIGGLQAQRNFALRPDLITMPLPSVGGSAAVPSTVDVYVNNIKTFSQNVGSGPFSISNIPLITGAGNTEIVVTDSAGHQTRTSAPFYASANLLAPELTSWSVEAGFPRLAYGSTSDSYVATPVGSWTLRRGIFNWFTAESHVEAGAGVTNGGVGAVVRTGTFGVAGAAVSASNSSGNQGAQAYLSYETKLFGLSVFASSQRTFGYYDDLASATSCLQSATLSTTQSVYGLVNYFPSSLASPYLNASPSSPIYTSVRPPLAIDRITFSSPNPLDKESALSASFLHTIDNAGDLSKIISGTYTRSLPFNASMFATVFHDFGTSKNTGVFVGLTIPLSNSIAVSAGVSTGQGSTTSVDAVKTMDLQPGSYGWHIRDAEGASPSRAATASYRSNVGTVQAGVAQNGTNSSGALELRGSIATMNGGMFLSDWIDDGFAVVNVGAPGVEVLNENRPVGVTGANGMLLVPRLRSYDNNNVSVNPTNLPVDAEIVSTRSVVAPADRAGTLVQFKVLNNTNSALVTFVRENGGFVPAGSTGRIDGGDEFIVGYDGQAFVKELRDSNAVTIDLGNQSCRTNFEFRPQPGAQVQIGPVPCR